MGRIILLAGLLVTEALLFVVCRNHLGEQLTWRWSPEKASLTYSIKQHLQDYDVELVPPEDYISRTPITIRRKVDRRVVYSFKWGHPSIVFTRWNDTLFIAEYSPIASGCAVVALDLKTGSQLWRTPLQGNSPAAHSRYWNSVNIETNGERIIVHGTRHMADMSNIWILKLARCLQTRSSIRTQSPF